jgi:Spy/CpxP family protein refolding chaperone
MNPKKLLTALALTALLAPALASAAVTADTAAAGSHGNRDDRNGNPRAVLHNAKALSRFLKLTPEQAKTLQTLEKDLQAKAKPLADQIKPLHEQLRTLLDTASPDPCQAGEIVVHIDSLRDQIRAAFGQFDDSFSAILTPDQLARYEALKAAAGIGGDGEGDDA